MPRWFLLVLSGVLSAMLAVPPAVADIDNASATNVQEGDNDDESDQGGESQSGDAVAGQVIGVVSSGDASVDATNTTRDSSATSGDAEGENTRLAFVGHDGGGDVNVVADVGSGSAANVQDGDNGSDNAQAQSVASGDAVAGQVSGVVTSAGGTAEVVLANTTIDADVESGDAFGENLSVSLVGLFGTGGGDDGGNLALVISDDTVFEGDTLEFIVSVVSRRGAGDAADSRARIQGEEQPPPNAGVCFNYETSDGTANGETDYAPSAGGDCIPPGASSTTIHVPTIPDKDCEGTENMQVNLTSATGATIADGSGTGTIEDCGQKD